MPPVAAGKRQAECERLRPDTSCCRKSSTAILRLQPATAGSLGLNLETAVDVTLMTDRPVKLPTGVLGPVIIKGQAYGALLLGYSSALILGFFVLPGVINADYTGEIPIIAHTPFLPLKIEKGQ